MARPKKRPPRNPRVGFIIFASWDPPYEVECLLGDGAGNPIGGFGGWAKVKRDRRRSLTEWQGNDPLEIAIPILFDNWAEGTSVENEIKQLEKLAGLGNDDTDGPEPPLIVFNTGGVISHDYHDSKDHEWVISEIDFGDCVKNQFGNRVRQIATVTVLQYIDDDVLSRLSPSKKRKKQKKGKIKKGTERSGARQKTFIVKFTGQSLVAIAKDELGDGKRWHEIAKLNGIRDPKGTAKGMRLKMP